MRKHICFLLFITIPAMCTPQWYGNITSTDKYEIIGYGDGNSLDEAKAKAKADIAKTISSKITASVSNKTEVTNGNFSTATIQKTEEKSELILNETQIKMSEKNGETFFVALSYLNIPTENKLTIKGGKKLCGEPHPYLNKTEFVAKVSAELNCTASLGVTKENGAYFIGSGIHRIVLDNNTITRIMAPIANSNVKISPSAFMVKENDPFTLKITNLPNSGYISIFDVYANGKVVAMEQNIKLPLVNGQNLVYPNDIRVNFDLAGGVLEKGFDTMDMYVVLISKLPLEMSMFLPMGAEIENSEMANALDALLSLMKTVPFATTVVFTKHVEK